ncbi:MAG: hypothetical protein RBT64_01475 [Trichloromonas sp.]|jgi:hypothetical protein|nr:hypothetical protein [Trichloromonas sp.]
MNEAVLKLLKSETGTEVVRENLKTEVTPAKDANEVWRAVREFAGEEGWLCLTDKVLKIDQPSDLDKSQGRVILSGELVKGARSLHVRQAQEGWSLVYLSAGQGDECLKFNESFISTEEGQAVRLTYEVYWKSDGSAYAPHAFRFTGFAKGDTQA